MFAGVMSMAAGAYLSGKAEVEVYQREIEEERQRFVREPYLASEELLEAMTQEGLSREKAYRIVKLFHDEEESLLKTFQEKVLGLGSVNPKLQSHRPSSLECGSLWAPRSLSCPT